MSLNSDTIANIHPVYRDFMMALKPIIDSRSQPFQIGGMSASKIYDAAARKYGYDVQQFYAIAENLRRQNLIELDKYGFYSPTPRGEQLILEIFRQLFPGEPDPDNNVPPLDLGGLWDGD